MTGVFIRRGNLSTGMQRENEVKRQREKTAVYKPRREARNSSSLTALREGLP